MKVPYKLFFTLTTVCGLRESRNYLVVISKHTMQSGRRRRNESNYS